MLSLTQLNNLHLNASTVHSIKLETISDFFHIKKYIEAQKIKKYVILGDGTNTFLQKELYKNTLFILNHLRFIKIYNNFIEVSSGIKLEYFISKLIDIDRKFLNIKAFTLIPGTIGGATAGNVSFGKGFAFGDLIDVVKVFNLKKGTFSLINSYDCSFETRESIFKKNRDLAIVSIFLDLNKRLPSLNINYDEYKQKRAKYPTDPSLGCWFKPAFVPITNKKVISLSQDIMRFKFKGISTLKIPAGFLIEKAGLKGFTIGGAQVSTKHANFLINTGNATATDFNILSQIIKNQVKKKFDVKLTEEIIRI